MHTSKKLLFMIVYNLKKLDVALLSNFITTLDQCLTSHGVWLSKVT